MAEVYGSVITAGVHRASSIKVAEAAKVIENTQRDLNIALVNELSLIFHRIGIDTLEVLEAAGTKWNFLPFRPGLVGGHCIGVDPYYLTHKAEKLGYHPQVILAGRRINDGMGKYIAEQTVKQMIQPGLPVKGAHVNVLGLTFKENCPDLRNSKVIDVIRELRELRRDRARARSGGRRRRGAARVRRRAGAVGATCRAPAPSSPPSRTRSSSSARSTSCCTKLSHGRRVRRRQVHGRRAGVARAWGQRLAAVTACSTHAQRSCSTQARRAAGCVTGSAGFIGSHLLEALLRSGRTWSASTTSRPATAPTSTRCAMPVGEAAWARHRFIEGDIARPSGLRARPATASSSCCTRPRSARCRARSTIRWPRTAPTPPASSTCWSPRATPGCERFVYAASSSTYGDSPTLPKVEDVIGRPLSPYAVTKYVNELYADVFGRCYGLATIGLRYFNVFGPRQDPEGAYAAVIPRWVAAMLRGRALRHQRRRRDLARLLLSSPTWCRPTCARRWSRIRAALNQVYNVAVGERTTLLQLHELLARALRDAAPGLVGAAAGLRRLPRRRRAPFAGRHRQGPVAAGLRSPPTTCAPACARPWAGTSRTHLTTVHRDATTAGHPLVDIIAGARPNFMKIAPIIRAIDARRAARRLLRWRLVHTGQHYDARMSADFFEQLEHSGAATSTSRSVPGTQAEQTAAIMVALRAAAAEGAQPSCVWWSATSRRRWPAPSWRRSCACRWRMSKPASAPATGRCPRRSTAW